MRSRETLQPRMGLASYQGRILDMMRIGTFLWKIAHHKCKLLLFNYYYDPFFGVNRRQHQKLDIIRPLTVSSISRSIKKGLNLLL